MIITAARHSTSNAFFLSDFFQSLWILRSTPPLYLPKTSASYESTLNRNKKTSSCLFDTFSNMVTLAMKQKHWLWIRYHQLHHILCNNVWKIDSAISLHYTDNSIFFLQCPTLSDFVRQCPMSSKFYQAFCQNSAFDPAKIKWIKIRWLNGPFSLIFTFILSEPRGPCMNP